MIGQFIGYIIGAYVVYYVGNIIYDLFLAKQKVPKEDDDGEIISLGDIVSVERTTVSNISIEDVESVNMPESYEVDESQLYSENATNEEYDISLQKNYEEEESSEWYESEEAKVQKDDLNKVEKSIKELYTKGVAVISEKKEFFKNKVAETNEGWENALAQAQMEVVMTQNNGGHKSYKSTSTR